MTARTQGRQVHTVQWAISLSKRVARANAPAATAHCTHCCSLGTTQAARRGRRGAHVLSCAYLLGTAGRRRAQHACAQKRLATYVTHRTSVPWALPAQQRRPLGAHIRQLPGVAGNLNTTEPSLSAQPGHGARKILHVCRRGAQVHIAWQAIITCSTAVAPTFSPRQPCQLDLV